jgi:hypothetical protein
MISKPLSPTSNEPKTTFKNRVRGREKLSKFIFNIEIIIQFISNFLFKQKINNKIK